MVADIIAAEEEQKLNDMISGISDDKTSERLERLRSQRTKAKAKATVSSELAGTDTKVQTAKFKKFASKRRANSKFDALLGIAKEAESPSTSEGGETTKETKLPG